MKKIDQTGFAAIEAVLVCVILGIIGFTGYFVWHAKQNTDESLNNTASSQPGIAKKKAVSVDPTGKWLTVNSMKGTFSIQVPDGWVGYNYGGADQFRFTDIAVKDGTKPSVTNVASPYAGDSEVPLYVELFQSGPPFATLIPDPTLDDFKLGSYGGTRFYKAYSESTPQGVGARSKGDADYAYQLEISDNETLYIYYNLKAGEIDQHSFIETFISGIKLN